MAYTCYADYVIYFTNEDEYNFAVAYCGGRSFEGSPDSAGALFGFAVPTPGGVNANTKGVYGFYPYIVGHPAVEVQHPNPSGIFLDGATDFVTVPGQAGNPPSAYSTGDTMILRWRGTIQRNSGGILPFTPQPQRRWISGIELPPLGEGGTGGNTGISCRDSSRTLEGMGLAIRGQNFPGSITHQTNQYIVPAGANKSWERFYFRLRTPPAATSRGVWRCHHNISPSAGASLKINPNGQIEIYTITSTNVETLQATFNACVVDTWYKVDVQVRYPTGIVPETDGQIAVTLTGPSSLGDPQTIVYVDTSGGSLDTIGNHASTEIGRYDGGTDNIVEYDIDDWINAELLLANNLDFVAGIHIRKQYTEIGNTTGWTGQIGSVNGVINSPNGLSSDLRSTTALARIDGTTDVTADPSDASGITIGPINALVSLESQNGGGTDGTLGYSAAGAPEVMTSVNQVVGPGSWTTVPIFPINQFGAFNAAPWKNIHDKSNDANQDITRSLATIMEYVGVWGPEDSPQLDFPRLGYLHNCRYPNSIWGFIGPVPDAPCYMVGGTYVGNGNTAQVINLPAPCHFLWIRALTGGATGVKWFGTGLSGNRGVTERTIGNYPTRVWMDSVTGQTQFLVTGTDVEINAVGVTYQYVAFCDPGMRFNLCGAYNRPSVLTSGNIALQCSDFLATAGFIQNQQQGTSNVTGLQYKGPGFSGLTGQTLSGTALANFGAFSLGNLNTRIDSHFSTAGQTVFSLWRTTDILCGFVGVQITSYVGNGAGSQVIPLTPASLRFPLFALVVPHAVTGAFMRDPSHTGSNSCRVDNLTNSTTAIIGGGIDTITVGSTLNVNLTVYDVFVIPGDTAGWNNGIFFPPNCSADPTAFPTPPFTPPEIGVLGDGGLELGSAVSLTLLKDVTGIYTLTPGKTSDTLYDRQTGQPSVERKIPDPTAKTGYIGG